MGGWIEGSSKCSTWPRIYRAFVQRLQPRYVRSVCLNIKKSLSSTSGRHRIHKPIQTHQHCFLKFCNQVDLTCMRDNVSDNENDGSVKMIAIGNQLGDGIRTASLPELGSGGSWSTCAIGCNQDPPRDVAHVQFRSRIGE